jgi:hypothetical protein
MFRKAVPLALALLVTLASAATAHEHNVMGTVTMTGVDHVMMRTPDGHDVTVKITKDTKITKDNKTVNADTLKEGTRIVVTTASDETPYTAMAIKVGATAKPPVKK